MTNYPSNDLKPLKIFIAVSLVFTSILGVLLHFAYDYSGQMTWVSLFSPVNESTWEHLKLLFFPLLIVSVVGFLILQSRSFGKNFTARFFTGNLYGVLAGMAFIIVSYYTITGVIGRDFAPINIAIFFVAVLLAHMIFYHYLTSRQITEDQLLLTWIAVLTWIVIATLFVFFTFLPPDIGLFADPLAI